MTVSQPTPPKIYKYLIVIVVFFLNNYQIMIEDKENFEVKQLNKNKQSLQ